MCLVLSLRSVRVKDILAVWARTARFCAGGKAVLARLRRRVVLSPRYRREVGIVAGCVWTVVFRAGERITDGQSDAPGGGDYGVGSMRLSPCGRVVRCGDGCWRGYRAIAIGFDGLGSGVGAIERDGT